MQKKSFLDNSVKDFINIVASKTPTPGGGTVSAAVTILGTSLGIMAMQFSEDKISQDIISILREIQEKQLPLLDEDAYAYGLVQKARALPKVTQEEKERRTSKIHEALQYAAEVPLKNIEISFKALEVLNNFAPKCNKNLASDLGVSTLILTSGIKGSALNVIINANCLKDNKTKEKLKSTAQDLVSRVEKLQENILDIVNKMI